MKVMVIVKASKDSEAGVMPSEQLLSEMNSFNEELVKAGVMLAGEGLTPSSRGARVRFAGKTRTVIDGPFAETKELIAGFWLWKVASLQEAIEWLKKCPNPHYEDGEIEIRPVFEIEEFGDAMTPELKEKSAAMRAQGIGLGAPRFENHSHLLIGGVNETYTFESRVNIPNQWTSFMTRMGTIPGQVGSDSYGVCWNFQPGRGFDYLTGVEIKNGATRSADLSYVELPAQRYAIFTHQGHVSAIPKTIEAIWSTWLPDSGLTAADAPCFERYTKQFNPQTGMGGTEIWIPLAL